MQINGISLGGGPSIAQAPLKLERANINQADLNQLQKNIKTAEIKKQSERVELKDGKPVDPDIDGIVWIGSDGDNKVIPYHPFGRDAKYSTRFSGGSVSRSAWDLNKLMNENNGDVDLMTGFGASEQMLAEHFGEIGQKIDAAFSAGHISRQEYDELNKGLDTYIENITSKAERRAAHWECGKEIAKATRALIESHASDEEMAAYAKNVQDTLQDKISACVKEYCNIDRSFMKQLVNQVRNGQRLFPIGTAHTYGRENTRNYFKNGYVPFTPVSYP